VTTFYIRAIDPALRIFAINTLMANMSLSLQRRILIYAVRSQPINLSNAYRRIAQA